MRKQYRKTRKIPIFLIPSRGGKENLWEMVPMKLARKNYKIEIRKCHKSDIIEIDNFIELIAADPSYAQYPGYEAYSGE